MSSYEYRHSLAVAELVKNLAQRGIKIVLTGQGPIIEFNGEDVSDEEAELLAAHRWNLWRYLPPPSSCLQCNSPLTVGSRSWECQACLDMATGWQTPDTKTAPSNQAKHLPGAA